MHYVSNTDEDRRHILRTLGAASLEDLVANVPSALRRFDWDAGPGLSEVELSRRADELASRNAHFRDWACYLGAGVYDHYVPPVVDRLALRGEFITSYTPYQGEASQGTLQSIYEYQSLVCELTAMDVSNASMYDGASALAEAVLVAIRSLDRRRVLVPRTVHPEYRAVLRTYLSCIGAEIVEIAETGGAVDRAAYERELDERTAAVVVQQPNFLGYLEEARELAASARARGAIVIACVNPVSLGVIEPPGDYGADIAVGEGQPLGNAVSYGGPHFGFFAVKEPLLRRIPGRIAGVTTDRQGRRAFVLTLQAREQHIRREKATSNICTNQALCALKGAVYLSLLGRQGIRRLALLNLALARTTHDTLVRLDGVRPYATRPFFNEFALKIDADGAALRRSMRERRILGPLALDRFDKEWAGHYLVAVTEKRTPGDLQSLRSGIEEAVASGAAPKPGALGAGAARRG